MYPDKVKTFEDKVAFCKSGFTDRNYNRSLDLCVPDCGIEEVIDPQTGDCSNIVDIQSKFKVLQKKADFDYMFLVIIMLSIFMTFILVLIYNKKKGDDPNTKTNIYYGLAIYVLCLSTSLLIFGNSISLIPLVGIQIYSVYTIS